MNYSQYESDEARFRYRGQAKAGVVRAARLALWAIVNVTLVFVELVAELLAPLLLMAGAAWWALPRVLSLVVLDGQANDVLRGLAARLPTDMLVAGTWLSAPKLITDAILLFAVVAVCRTIAALMTRALFTDR